MEKLTITAGQVCVGDILPNGYTVEDFEFRGDSIYILSINMESGFMGNIRYDRNSQLTVETEYLDREPDNFDSDSENWEDALEDDTTEMNCADADGISEDVGDLLDH